MNTTQHPAIDAALSLGLIDPETAHALAACEFCGGRHSLEHCARWADEVDRWQTLEALHEAGDLAGRTLY